MTSDLAFPETSTLDDLEVAEQLIYESKNGDEASMTTAEIRGGAADALIVQATTTGKQSELHLMLNP